MARTLFGIEKGLRLLKENLDAGPDNSIDFLFGAGAPPGTTGETDEAEIGSIYSNTTNGDFYRKVTDTSSASDWVVQADPDSQYFQVTGVGATATVIDSVVVDDVLACEWELHAREESSPSNVKVIKILATHNGTIAGDASLVDDTAYGKLRIGASFVTQYEVELNGTGAGQVMRLSVTGEAASAVTFTVRRNVIVAP